MRYALAILAVLVAVGCPTPEEPSLPEETQEATAEVPVVEDPEEPETTVEDTEEDEPPDRLLRDGVFLAMRDRDGTRPVIRSQGLRNRDSWIHIPRPEDFQHYVTGVPTHERAEEYFRLLRLVLPQGSEAARKLGTPLRPVNNALPFNGEYSPEDAHRWEIPFEPEITRQDDTFQVQRAVLIYDRYFQVVLLEEQVTRDGEYSSRVVRVLDPNGENYYIPVF